MNNDDLLSPTLGETTTQSIYAPGALIAAAFFGGAFAVPLLATLNSRRLGRLRRDTVWIALGLVAVISMFLGLLSHYYPVFDEDVRRTVRLASRGMGFALAGCYYLLHRQSYRTMTTMGLDAPSPYIPVISVILLSVLLTVGLLSVWLGVVAPWIGQ